MEFKLILRFLAPLLGIVIGIALKVSENLKNNPMRKYWMLFLIGGILLLAFRVYKVFR